jgi:hypothetical protein
MENPMVKLEWGHKRTCLGCSARFYDMRRTPIACPKCGTVLELTTTRTRRGRNAAKETAHLTDMDLGDDITLVDDVDTTLDDDTDLIENADDLDEGLDDIPSTLDSNEDV